MREILSSEHLPVPRFRYSPMVKTGSYYQTAGMIALDSKNGELETGGVIAETKKILSNLTLALPDFGLLLKDLVIVRIYTTKFDDFPLINQVWDTFFPVDMVPPARTAVGVSALPLQAHVEMEFTFYKRIVRNSHTLP